MTEQEVVDLMKSSKTEDEWNANCDKVKKAFDGYPSFWFSAIILSGVHGETVAAFIS
jgi:hypothetical protein